MRAGHRGALAALPTPDAEPEREGEALLDDDVDLAVGVLVDPGVTAGGHHVETGAAVRIRADEPVVADGAHGDRSRAHRRVAHRRDPCVARRGNHHGRHRSRCHGIAERRRRRAPGEREVDDLRPLGHRPVDALDDRGVVTRPVLVEDLAREDLGQRRNPRDSRGVVRGLRDRTGDVRAVAVVVVGVRVIVDEVVPREDSPGVSQVPATGPHAGVEHRHDDVLAGGGGPSRLGIRGPLVGRAVGLHVPLLRVERVVGRRRRVDGAVALGEAHVGPAPIGRQRAVHVAARDDVDARARQAPHRRCPGRTVRRGRDRPGARRVGPKGHEQLTAPPAGRTATATGACSGIGNTRARQQHTREHRSCEHPPPRNASRQHRSATPSRNRR